MIWDYCADYHQFLTLHASHAMREQTEILLLFIAPAFSFEAHAAHDTIYFTSLSMPADARTGKVLLLWRYEMAQAIGKMNADGAGPMKVGAPQQPTPLQPLLSLALPRQVNRDAIYARATSAAAPARPLPLLPAAASCHAGDRRPPILGPDSETTMLLSSVSGTRGYYYSLAVNAAPFAGYEESRHA